jgi:hypothetical protein
MSKKIIVFVVDEGSIKDQSERLVSRVELKKISQSANSSFQSGYSHKQQISGNPPFVSEESEIVSIKELTEPKTRDNLNQIQFLVDPTSLGIYKLKIVLTKAIQGKEEFEIPIKKYLDFTSSLYVYDVASLPMLDILYFPSKSHLFIKVRESTERPTEQAFLQELLSKVTARLEGDVKDSSAAKKIYNNALDLIRSAIFKDRNSMSQDARKPTLVENQSKSQVSNPNRSGSAVGTKKNTRKGKQPELNSEESLPESDTNQGMDDDPNKYFDYSKIMNKAIGTNKYLTRIYSSDIQRALMDHIMDNTDSDKRSRGVQILDRLVRFGRAFMQIQFIEDTIYNTFYKTAIKLDEKRNYWLQRVMGASAFIEKRYSTRDDKTLMIQVEEMLKTGIRLEEIGDMLNSSGYIKFEDLIGYQIYYDKQPTTSKYGYASYTDVRKVSCPILVKIIENLDYTQTSDFFSKTDSPQGPSLTPAFKHLLECIDRLEGAFYLNLFEAMTKESYDNKGKKAETGFNFFLSAFYYRQKEFEKIKELVLYSANSNSLRYQYLDWLASSLINSQLSNKRIFELINQLIIKPFEGTYSEDYYKLFYPRLFAEVRKLNLVPADFLRSFLQSVYINKELKLSLYKECLVPLLDSEDKYPDHAKLITEIFERPELLNTNKDASTVTIQGLLETLQSKSLVKYEKYRKEFDTKDDDFVHKCTRYLKSDKEFAFVIRLVNIFMKNQTEAKKTQDLSLVYISQNFKETNLFMRCHERLSSWITFASRRPLSFGSVSFLYEHLDDIKSLQEIFFGSQNKTFIDKIEKAYNKKVEADEKLREIKKELESRDNAEQYNKFAFYQDAKTNLAELNSKLDDKFVEDVVSNDKYEDLCKLMNVDKKILKVLLGNAELASELKNCKNDTVESFIENIQSIKEQRIREYIDFVDKDMKLSDYQKHFSGIEKPEQRKVYEDFLKDLGVEELFEELYKISMRFYTYCKLREMLLPMNSTGNEKDRVSSFTKFLRWESIKKIKENSEKAKELEDLQKVMSALKAGETDISYSKLEKIDNKKLTLREEFKNFNPKVIESLSTAEKAFDFIKNNGKAYFEQLKYNVESEHVDLIVDAEKIASKLSYLVEITTNLDDILKKLFEKESNSGIENTISHLEENLKTLEHLKLKTTGDFKLITESILNKSDFIIKFDSRIDEFIYLTKTAENEQLKEDVEENAFDMDDMTDHFTKATIRANELKRAKAFADNEKADSNLKNIEEFMNLGKEIKEFKLNLKKLYNIGLISSKFDSRIEKYLKDLSNDSKITFRTDKYRLVLRYTKDSLKGLSSINKHLSDLSEEVTNAYYNTITSADKNGHILTYFTKGLMYNLTEMAYLKPNERKQNKDKYADVLNVLKQATGKLSSDQREVFAIKEIDANTTIEKTLESIKNFTNQLTMSDGIDPPQSSRLAASKVILINTSKLGGLSTFHDGKQVHNPIMKNLLKDSYDKSPKTNSYDFMMKVTSDKEVSRLGISQILYCSELTTSIDIQAFVARALLDPKQRQYFILNIGVLSNTILDAFTSILREIMSKTGLKPSWSKLIIFNNSSFQIFENQDLFINKDDAIDAVLQDKKGSYLESQTRIVSKLLVVESELSGEGKTYRINSIQKKANKDIPLIVLSIAGEINKNSLDSRLEVLTREISGKKFSLHIKLDYLENFNKYGSMIDYMLFCLCYTWKFYSEKGYTDLEDQLEMIYIEIGNSNKNKLRYGLEVIDMIFGAHYDNISRERVLLKRQWIYKVPTFDADNIEYSSDPNSDFQIAAQFLELYRSQLLKRRTIIKKFEKQGDCTELTTELNKDGLFLQPISNSEVIDEAKYKSHLSKYFKPKQRTFFNFVLWTSIIAKLKKNVDQCSLLNENTSILKDEKDFVRNLRSETNEEILIAAEEFLDLQSDKARECQRIVVDIFDCNDRDEIETRLQREKDKLERLINSMEWDTTQLYLPLIVGNDIIPVTSNSMLLNKNTKREETLFATKKFYSNLQKEFEKLGGTATEHRWFIFLFSKLQLYDGKTLSFQEMEERTANFDNDDIQESLTFEKVPRDQQKKDKNPLKSKKGFSLTKHTFTKLCLMIFKAQLRHPIIIMGESGCGKTYLSMFLAKGLLGDEFKMKTLYSGFSEAKLVEFIEKCIDLANELAGQNKRLCVFFDEFNTTAIQSLIADVILDRVLPINTNSKYSKIPDNILFIACCNPFRIKLEKSSADIGLVPNEKSSLLSHIVHPIPERLLNLIWDFGQLSETDEANHIYSMVRSEKFFLFKNISMVPAEGERIDPDMLNDEIVQQIKEKQLTQLVFRCHTVVRGIEARSGVSLRDIKRVLIFFRWFCRQISKIKYYLESDEGAINHFHQRKREFWFTKSEDILFLGGAVCATMICYYLRLNGQPEGQNTLSKLIRNWVISFGGLNTISQKQIIGTYNLISEVFLFHIKDSFPPDITVNTPFKENFITLLACYAEKIPVIIVGAPGTSKTLSVNTLLQCLEENKAKYPLLDDFEIQTTQYFGGSENSTAESVNKLFINAKKIYENKIKNNGKAPVIFFDELGLAELSPYNPLKVMHSELEENMGKIAFFAISNWRIDLSKQNRMIFISRPDMSKDDLTKIADKTLVDVRQLILNLQVEKTRDELEVISNTMLQDSAKTKDKGYFNVMYECLAEAYLNFRVWQKKITTNGSVQKQFMYHSNFHGSRDIYSVYKKISADIRASIKDLVLSSEEDRQKICLYLVKSAIERNLNGERYVFGTDNELLKIDILCSVHTEGGDIQLIDRELQAMVFNKKFVEMNKFVRMDDLQDVYTDQETVDCTAEVLNPFDEIIVDGFSSPSIEFEKFNFSLSSSQVFKLIFLNLLYFKAAFPYLSKSSNKQTNQIRINEFVEDLNVIDLMVQNLTSITTKKDEAPSRFVIIRTEGAVSEEVFIKRLRSEMKKPEMLIDWRATNENIEVEDMLSYLKTYISSGYTIVMKNLDKLYGGLYDLFNQKFKESGGKLSCTLYYGESKHNVIVNPEFKCVVILPTNSATRNSKDIEKLQPAPFLNRFEKYYIHLSKLLEPEVFSKIMYTRQLANRLSDGKTSCMPGLTIDLITSAVVNESMINDPFASPPTNSEILENLIKVCTSNFMLNRFLTGDQIEAYNKIHSKTTIFSLCKEIENLSEEAAKYHLSTDHMDDVADKSKEALFNLYKGKAIILTFTPSDQLTSLLKGDTSFNLNHDDMNQTDLSSFTVVTAESLMKGGVNRREDAFKSLENNTKYLVQFTKESDFELIQTLRNLVDNTTKVVCALFVVHISVYARERKRLAECSGISFWSNWNVMAIDRLEQKNFFKTLYKLRERSILESVLGEENNEEDEDDSEDEYSNVVLNTKNWIMIRVVMDALRDLLKDSKNEDINVKLLKQLIDKNQLTQSNFVKALNIIRSNLRTAINGQDQLVNKDLMLIEGTGDITSLLRDDDYKSFDTLLGQAFYLIFNTSALEFFKKYNSSCMNLSTCLLGVLGEIPESFQEKTLKWMEASGNKAVIPKIQMMQMPQEFYLPLAQTYVEANKEYKNILAEFIPGGTKLKLMVKEFVRITQSSSGKEDANFKQKREDIAQMIKIEERKIFSISEKLIEFIMQSIKKDKIKPGDIENAREKFIIDLLKLLFYNLLKPGNFYFETYSLLYELCKDVLLKQSVFESNSKVTKDLFVMLVLFITMKELPLFILSSIRQNRLTAENLKQIVKSAKNRIKVAVADGPNIDYILLDAVHYEFNLQYIVPSISSDKEQLEEYREFLSDGTVDDKSYFHPLKLIFQILETFTGSAIVPGKHCCWSDLRKEYLAKLKDCTDKVQENSTTEILNIGTKVCLDYISNRQSLNSDFILIQNYIQIWCSIKNSLDPLINNEFFKILMSPSLVKNHELICLSTQVSNMIIEPLKDYLTQAKWKEMLTAEKEAQHGSDGSMLNSIIRLFNLLKTGNENDEPSNRKRLMFSLFLENLIMYIESSHRELAESIDGEVFFLDEICKLFRDINTCSGFLQFIAFLLLRLVFTERFFKQIKDERRTDEINQCFKTQLDSVAADTLPEKLFKSIQAYPLLYFMQGIFRSTGSITGESKIVLMQELQAQTRDPVDRSRIAFFSDEMIDRYNAIGGRLDSLVLQYHDSKTPALLDQIIALSNENACGSVKANMYIFGCYGVNSVLRDVKEEEKQIFATLKAKWIATFDDAAAKAQADSNTQLLCRLIANAGRIQPDCQLLFAPNSNPAIECRVDKLRAQIGLLSICFDNMGYTPLNYKQWANSILSNQLKWKYGSSRKIDNYIRGYEEVIQERFDPTGRLIPNRWGFDTLGCYVCKCGYMYTLDGCGMHTPNPRTGTWKIKCAGCGQWAGPDRDHGDPTGGSLGTTSVKRIGDLRDYIVRAFNESSNVYTPHHFLDKTDEIFKTFECVELTAEQKLANIPKLVNNQIVYSQVYIDLEYNFYFRHVVDHLYLSAVMLFIPPQEQKNFNDLIDGIIKVKDVNSEAARLKPGQITNSQKYFLAHVKNDLDKIADLVKVDKNIDILEWFKAVLSKMAEKIISNSAVDPQTKLYLDRAIFNNPQNIIKEQETRTDKMANATVNKLKTTLMDFTKRTVDFSTVDVPANIKTTLKTVYNLCNHHHPNASSIKTLFKQNLDALKSKYELLYVIGKYEVILMEFPRILTPQLELCRYVTRKYNNKITKEEAASTKILASGDPVMEELHSNCLVSWDIINKYKAEFPEIFSFGFMCEQGIEIEEYQKRVCDKNRAVVYDFVITDSSDDNVQKVNEQGNVISTESYKFMKSIISSLIKNLHNRVVELINKQLGSEKEVVKQDEMGDKEQKKRQQGGKIELAKGQNEISTRCLRTIKLEDSIQDDLVQLELDLSNEIKMHASVDTNNLGKFILDYDKLQEKLAQLMRKPLILADDADLTKFQFSTKCGASETRMTELQIFFRHVSKKSKDDTLEPTNEVKEFIENLDHQNDPEKARKVFLLVVEICEYLHASLQFKDTETPVVALVENGDIQPELKQRILKVSKEVEFPVNVTILDLESFLNALKIKDQDYFFSTYCNAPLTQMEEKTISQAILSDDKIADNFSTLVKAIREYIMETIYPDDSKLKLCFVNQVVSENGLTEIWEGMTKEEENTISNILIKSCCQMQLLADSAKDL